MTRLDRAERALWLKLANLWDAPRIGSTTMAYVSVDEGSFDVGLCDSIRSVCYYDYEMEERMRVRLHRHKKAKLGGYYWPCDRRGAKSRAAFCRRQAKALERA